MRVPVSSLGAGVSPADVFAAMDLSVSGKQVSSNIMYFVPTKQVHLPAARIETTVTGANGSYNLHLSSPMLARSVYVSFGKYDAKYSDNYFDLLPGESVDIRVSSGANLDELRQSMKIVSLADAFVSNSTQKGFPWK